MIGKKVVLLRNEREEWELPGGKLEPGETSEECVAREIQEELNLRVEVGPLLDAWLYEVIEGVRVFVVTYGCHAESTAGMSHSAEHTGLDAFDLGELDEINLPEGYKNSIRALAGNDAGGSIRDSSG